MVINPFHDATENRTSRKATHMFTLRVVHKHQAHIARIFSRRKPNERSHLRIAVVRASQVVVLFSRTRLAAKQNIFQLLRCHALCRTAVHHAIEHLADGRRRLFRNNSAEFNRLVPFDNIAIRIAPFLHNLRAHEKTTIRNGGISHYHLDRRRRNSVSKAHRL